MSFLRDYEIFSGNNECPTVFHTWTSISALSSLVSRRVYFDLGLFRYYPSLYILLVGNAGVSKSTSMDIAEALIEQVEDITISAASITKERLTQIMGEEDSVCERRFKNEDGESETYRHMSLFCNELVTLLNAGGNSGGMIDFLTDIWNRKVFRVDTKHAGQDTIDAPFLTLCGCLTTDKLSNLVSQKIFSSGFNRRCIFVYSAQRGKPVPIPHVSQEQLDAWDRCLVRAREINQLSGRFTFDDESRAFWEDWYTKLHDTKAYETSRFRRDYLETKPEFVLKVAMLTSLSESNDMTMTKQQLELAIALLEQIEPQMHVAFESSGRNELSNIGLQIKEYVLRSPAPVTYPKILAEFWSEAESGEIKDIVDHLIKTHQLQELVTPINGKVLKLIARLDYELDTDLLLQQLEHREETGS